MGSPERLTLTTAPPPDPAATPSESRPVRAPAPSEDPSRHLPIAVAWLVLIASVTARVAITVTVGLALWAVVPTVFGQVSTVVMSDSMAPGLWAGDVVIAHPTTASEVRFGQVLLVTDPDRPDRLRLHRLIGKRDGELILRGDANPVADSTPVHPSAVHAVGVLRVPGVGLPLLWVRTGQPQLAVGAFLLVAVLVILTQTDRLLPGPAPVRRPRDRAVASAGVLVLLLPLVVAAPHPSAAGAVFSGTTSNPTSTWYTTIVACTPPAYAPTPYLRYSFENVTAGTSETNTQGASYTGTLGSGISRQQSSCTPNTAFIRSDGTSNGWVASQTSITAPTTFSLGIWYRAGSSSTKNGRIAGLSQSSTSTASTSSYDAVLYANKGNHDYMTFAVTTTSGTYSCDVTSSAPSTSWEFAVAVFDSGTLNLYVNPSGAVANTANSCSASPTGALAHGGYWRAGADTLTAYSATTPGTWSGDLDEMTVWNSALSFAQAKSIYTLSH